MEYLTNRIDGSFDRLAEWPLRYCKCFETPIQLYAHKELMETLHRCLSKLPGRLAKAFTMREIDGLSTKEICQALNITSANCWVMLHRAKRRLRACIETHRLDFTE